MRFIFAITVSLCFLVKVPAFAQDDSDLSYLTNELTHHIVTVIRAMRTKGVVVDGYCTECSHKMQIRHTFHRAIDVDRHLSAFLKMHGEEVEERQILHFKKYNEDDIVVLLQGIDAKLELILAANDLMVDHSTIPENKRGPRDHYAVMERIENFMLSIGSPSVLPKNVLRRVMAISQVVRSLCASEVCPSVEKSPVDLLTPKMPIHVYREANKLITGLRRYVLANGIEIEGGVTAPLLSKEFITPRIVNKTCGILLADLIEVRHQIGGGGTFRLPGGENHATPTHVWRELNFARRYLEELIY
ncbi:hypothetical protein [Terasakiella sp. SH-1]|uniref:hypothetical protein n=1 Tax=Terasakiella sp. SH-1 TaxID=2560057 RepID=UPI001073655B|nr:hypothetical protein [Terasakiella sp. SH-1]